MRPIRPCFGTPKGVFYGKGPKARARGKNKTGRFMEIRVRLGMKSLSDACHGRDCVP